MLVGPKALESLEDDENEELVSPEAIESLK